MIFSRSGYLGKSHLILSKRDINTLSAIAGNNIIQTDDSGDFVIELSNTLTASIIEIMKEELNLNARYSDTSMVEYFAGDISKVIHNEFWQHTDLVYTNAVFFPLKSIQIYVLALFGYWMKIFFYELTNTN